jgi:hypothetical protein
VSDESESDISSSPSPSPSPPTGNKRKRAEHHPEYDDSAHVHDNNRHGYYPGYRRATGGVGFCHLSYDHNGRRPWEEVDREMGLDDMQWEEHEEYYDEEEEEAEGKGDESQQAAGAKEAEEQEL